MKVTFRLQEASSALTITTRSEGVLCYLPKQQQQKKNGPRNSVWRHRSRNNYFHLNCTGEIKALSGTTEVNLEEEGKGRR